MGYHREEVLNSHVLLHDKEISEHGENETTEAIKLSDETYQASNDPSDERRRIDGSADVHSDSGYDSDLIENAKMSDLSDEATRFYDALDAKLGGPESQIEIESGTLETDNEICSNSQHGKEGNKPDSETDSSAGKLVNVQEEKGNESETDKNSENSKSEEKQLRDNSSKTQGMFKGVKKFFNEKKQEKDSNVNTPEPERKVEKSVSIGKFFNEKKKGKDSNVSTPEPEKKTDKSSSIDNKTHDNSKSEDKLSKEKSSKSQGVKKFFKFKNDKKKEKEKETGSIISSDLSD